jgi:hypothetical protein
VHVLITIYLVNMSRDSSDGIATDYGLGDRIIGVQFPWGAGNFSLQHRVQTDSGVHPTSYQMGTGGFLPGHKAAGREDDRSSLSSAEVKEFMELHLPSPIRLHGLVLS